MSFMHRLFDSSLLQIFCDTSFIMTKSRKVFWDTVQSQVFFSGRKSRGFGEVVVSLIVTSIFCLHEPLFKTGKGSDGVWNFGDYPNFHRVLWACN